MNYEWHTEGGKLLNAADYSSHGIFRAVTWAVRGMKWVHTYGQKLLYCSRARDPVAVGEGTQERNNGIFLLLCELKVPKLSFVQVR